MASLTPGTLQKLLQNVGNKDFKVAGEHRSALLQVIGIVPSLEDDPWKSRGYFLRVSDSVHSAYVSVSDVDVDLILSDKIQLGQYIHVARLDTGSPVPVLRGIKPIPKRRPCVGDPKDLISSDFLNAKKVEGKVKLKVKPKKVVGNEEGNIRRLSFGNGKVGGVENRRLSLDSARKAWDRSPQSNNGSNAVKSKSKDRSLCSDSAIVTKKVLPNDSPSVSSISPPKSMNIVISPLKSKNIVISPKSVTKPIIKSEVNNLKSEDIFPTQFSKVVLSPQKWPDSKILWDSLPSTICELGKEVGTYRNVAFVSAICAVEEASIYESVIQCMSVFAELCDLSHKDSSGSLVEQYLNLHENLRRTSSVISTVINVRISDTKEGNDYSSQLSESGKGLCAGTASTNASLWVQAAVETDLSRFSLYSKAGDKSVTMGEKCHYIVIDNTPEKTDTGNHSPINKQNTINNGSNKSIPKVKSHLRRRPSTPKETNGGHKAWSPGFGLRDTAMLIKKLLSSSRAWFLDYLEDCLNNGFGKKPSNDGSQNVIPLGQLKKVNQWFDDAFQGGGGDDERIERLRKKLYRFLLEHVNSAVSRR